MSSAVEVLMFSFLVAFGAREDGSTPVRDRGHASSLKRQKNPIKEYEISAFFGEILKI